YTTHITLFFIYCIIFIFIFFFLFFFFFSSRRRHTRSKRDWSSDVCSSDLPLCERNAAVDRRAGDLEEAILRLTGPGRRRHGGRKPGDGELSSSDRRQRAAKPREVAENPPAEDRKSVV